MPKAADTEAQNAISSISVVQPLPRLMITLPKTDAGTPTILVQGMTLTTAAETPWGLIGDLALKLGGKLLGGGGGGGTGGCTTIKITNADGSSTEIKQCPPSGLTTA